MATNRGVAYIEPGKVEVQQSLPDLIPRARRTRRRQGCAHGVILKIVTTNICGSDQHMVRGRTTAPQGLILGHEITGEVIEDGQRRGDSQSRRPGYRAVQHRLRALPQLQGRQDRDLPERESGSPGAAYGYVDMGGWVGGQAEYVMVPYADFNLLKFPDKEKAMAKIRDLTLLSDIFPTGYHGACQAGVGPGTDGLYRRRGPGRSGRAAGPSCSGAAVVIVGDMIPERLAQAKSFGCEDDRPAQGRHAARADRADPRRAARWIAPSIASASKRTDTARMQPIERPATVLNSADGSRRARAARSASPACTSPAIRAAIDANAKIGAISASASAWAGRSRYTSTPASAR